MFGRKIKMNLEVTHVEARDAWVVREFGNSLNVLAEEDTKERAITTSAVLGNVFAEYVNRGGSCEVFVRDLDGTWGRTDTYGYDSEKYKG